MLPSSRPDFMLYTDMIDYGGLCNFEHRIRKPQNNFITVCKRKHAIVPMLLFLKRLIFVQYTCNLINITFQEKTYQFQSTKDKIKFLNERLKL